MEQHEKLMDLFCMMNICF